MNLEKLNKAVEEIVSREPAVRGRGEQATKQALVLPMLAALEYDIWNPAEVCPEFDADFAIKKLGQKEKVDLAVSLEGQPRIFFEVKSVECPLDGHQGQLARYFNAVPSASLAVLTNGIEYRFYTDTGDPNIMDSTPFYVARLNAMEQGLEVLFRFSKAVFSPNAIRDFATELIYTARMVAFLRAELDLGERDGSEHLVRWILASEKMYDGRVTSSVVERFAPIARNALQMVLREVVRRSLAAISQVVTPSKPIPQEPETADEVLATDAAESVKLRIVTTEKELEYFAAVKRVYEATSGTTGQIYEPALRREIPIELAYKDTTGYLAVYLNKPTWWCLRVVAEARQPWIGFNISDSVAAGLIPAGFARLEAHPYASFRLAVNDLRDIESLAELVEASFEKTIRDRRFSESAAV